MDEYQNLPGTGPGIEGITLQPEPPSMPFVSGLSAHKKMLFF